MNKLKLICVSGWTWVYYLLESISSVWILIKNDFGNHLRKAYSDKDVQKIDESSDKLNQTWNTISTKLYEQNQTEQATDNTEASGNDEVDDVDFEEVS